MPSIDVEDDRESCEWIVERAKTQLARNDRPGAKSWILTAKSLFPSRFIVQVISHNVRTTIAYHNGTIYRETSLQLLSSYV